MKKLLSITFSILFIVSCGGGGGGGSTPTTPPVTPAPTVNLSAEPTLVLVENTSTLTWSSSNATSCSASWTSQTVSSGSETVTITSAGNNSFSISCTGDGGTRSASVTVEGYRETDGVVVDGYISGAEVCIDEDESWTCDSNENSTTSDNEGKFTIRYANGNLVSIGGTDLDSQTLLDNLLITHKLTGHSDFKAVTPVTSVAAFMEDASLVNAALGIDSSIDVFTFDPVANKGDGGIYDYLYEKGNQLTVLAYALQNITNNLNTTTETTQDYFKAITEEIEKEYSETETKVDIETEAFITKTLDNVIAAKSATIDETAKTNTTKALASVLPVIQVKESDDTTTALIRFAVSTLQTDIQAIANGTATAETVTSYTSDIYNYIATDQDIDVSEIIPEETNQEPTITNLLQVYNSDENQTYAFQVEASDPEGDTIYYSLSGVDKEFFDINVTGLIKFKEAPDYENPLDSGKDNTYKINIDVSDSLTSSTNSNLNTQTSNSFSSNGNPDIKPSSNSLESNNSVNATEVHITNIDEDLIDLVFNTTDGTSSAAPTISIDMQIDELTKASEVHVLTWLKDSAQTWYYATKNDSLNWSINETLNKYASAGTYEIRKVLIRRNDLDDLTIVDTALKEKGFDIDAVIANSNSDSINPELKGVDSITVSGNDGDAETNIIVTIVISVEDNESGVEKAFSYIKGPGGEITGSWGTLNEEKNKVTFTFTLDPRTGSGTYTIDDIRITDNAGNQKIYTNSEISGLSFTNSWSITNQISDNQAPNIIALSLTPSLNASDLNRKQITIDITTDDQVTDINDIYIRLINPDNANIDQYIVADGRLFTTTKNGNKYSHTISLPLEYPDGTYTISYIFINDKALNNKQYSAAELSELGFDTSVIFGQVANSSPVFTSNSSFTVAENQTSAATITVTDADSDSISFSLSGTDADSFAIASSGVLTFNNAPDYETKESYSLIVTASDGTSSVSQTISINISNVNEVPQISALSSTQSPDENQTSIISVSASDPDANTNLTYSISGTDSSLFSISSSGVLTFKTAPDYETPGDADADNSYQINIVVSDGSLSVTQAITIQVQNVADLISGVAVDGYVAGATVFQDLNNDGDLDSGEPSAATNSLGSFSLNLSSVNINAPVRIYNGFDLASNEIHPSIMDISVSETGSYIVTPISTLVGRLKIEDTSLTAMVPQSMIAGALGISLADSPNDSILGFDPIAYFNGSDATLASEARPVFAASQLLMTMGGGNYSVHKYITDQVLSTLSSTLTTAAGSSITLSSANDILGLKQDAYDAIFNGYVDTTLANNSPINSIQFRNNKAVMTDYLNGSSSNAVNYSLYGVHDGTTTLVADLVGAKLDYDNLKQILDNDSTGTPMDLNFELANIPAAGSGSTGVTLKLFMGADTTQASDEDYLQIALTANWESDGTNFTIKLPASSSITASFFDRGGTTLSITPSNQVEDIFTVTQDGPNRPATLSLRLSKLFNAFPSEVTGLSSFLDGVAEFTYLVEFDNFSIYDHLDNTFTKIQGTFAVDANPGITVFADDIYVHENATSKDISFYLSQAASSDVTLDYAIADASSASSSDYTLSAGTITIPAGSMSTMLTIPVTNDTTVEAQEEIRLTLSNVQNAVLGRSSVSAFITDGEEILANSTQKAILADNIFKDSKASINAYIKNKLDTSTVTISGTSYTYSQVLINNSVTTDVYAYLDSIIDDYEVMSETLISTIMTKADAYIDSQLSSFASYTGFATALTQLNSGIKGLNMSQIVGTNINTNGSFPSGQNATTLQTALDGKVDTLVTLAADTVADILGTDTNTNFPNANVVMGTDGDDTITGTSGSDLIASFGGTDTVNALAGNDKILGGAGVDTLNGGDNDDHIYGYAGNDVLNGNADADKILGGKDNDTINGGAGNDDLRGEAGDDTITSGAGSDTISGGLGDDTIIIDAL